MSTRIYDTSSGKFDEDNPNRSRNVYNTSNQNFENKTNNIAENKNTNNDFFNILGNIGYSAGNGLINAWQSIVRNNKKRQDDERKLFDEFTPKQVLEYKNDKNNYENIFQGIDNKINKTGTLISNKLNEQKETNKTNIIRNIENSSNPISKKAAELSANVGDMAIGAGLGLVNPALSTTYFINSASQNYYDDAKDRGMTDEEAGRYSTIMGLAEGASEMIGVGNLVKGTKAISKNALKEGLKNLGISAADNFIQEAIIEPTSELVAGKYGNWDNMGQRMLHAGIDGALIGGIMAGAGAGIGSAVNVYDKVKNNQSVSALEINKAINDTKQAGINIDNNIQQNQTNPIPLPPVNTLENDQQTLYNNNESESGLYDRRNTNGIQESNLGSQKEDAFSIDRYKQEEAAIRKQGEIEYNNADKMFADKLKNKYNKKVFIFDDTNTSYGGGISYIDNDTIMFGRNALNDYGYDFLEGHEILEDINKNHKEISENILNNLKDKLQKDDGFGDVFLKYIADMNDNVYQYYIDKPDLIAKEIIGDLNGLRNANIDYKTLDNYKSLNPELVQEIQNEILNLENNIYSKNSNQSSFSIKENKPTPPINNIQEETKKVVPFRTEEQIANDKSISDLEALKEASQQVDTPILPRVQQLENELQENNIDRSPTIDYIKRKRSNEKPSIKEIKDTLAQRFVNKGHYIDKLANQTGNKRLTHLYDRTMNTFNEAQISIGDYQVNSKGDIVGDSLIDIFQPSVDSGLELEFEDYLLNKHNVARYAHEKGLYGSEITASDSADTVLKYEKLYPEFKEWAEGVYKYNDNNLKDLVDNGMVSQELYDNLKSMYGSYVPTYRDIVDNISQYEDNAVGSNPLKRATQSNRDILSVKESMAEQTLMQKKAIRMNNLGLELYKTLGKDSTILEGIEIDPLAMQTIGGDVVEKATDGTNIFTVFDDGEMKQFKISDELYSAFAKDTIQNRINNRKVAKALLTSAEKLTKAQRELLTTYSIGFALNNPVKDFQDALFYSKYNGATFVKNYTKALYNIATEGSWYQSYKNNGGMANTYFDYSKGILPVKTKNPVKKFANAIKNVNEVLEQAPRLAEYISTIENGGNIDEALYNAAEVTTNFKRGGDITKAFNKYGVNFLNASVQGLDKAYRSIMGQNGIKGYANLLTKALVYQIAPAVLNGLLLKDDKDYEDLPEYTKDNYFLIKMGDGKFFRIPKGRLSAVVGGIARRALETAEGKEVDWKALVDTTKNQLAPNNPFTDNVVAPIAQAIKNKSWYGGDIVNTRLQKLPTSEQYDESTDKISKWLGEKLNISPKKINYVLDQYSGGIGDVVLPMLTPQAENNILEDKFTTDAIMKNKNVSEYYSQLSELEKNSNSINATDKDKLKYKYITNTSSAMSDLYKQKREIQNSNISDKLKKEKVREVQKQINELAESTLKALDEDIIIKNNVADVSGTQYYKYNDKWTMLSDEDNEKTQNISLSTFADYKNKLYKLTQETEKEGSTVKDSDKIKILLNSKYSNKEKQELYKNYIGTTDKKYSIIEDLGIDINEYLKYKSQTFTGQKDVNGRTISGSIKSQIKDYINTLKLTPIQKTLLFNSAYKDTSYNEKVYNYIKNLNLTTARKKEIWDSLGYK